MLDAYNSGDPYLAFAKRVGAAPSNATKTSHAEVRSKYKVVLLATQYGMAAETLAARAGVSTFEAHEMLASTARYSPILEVVRRLGAAFPANWPDADGDGLDMPHGVTEFNERSIRNWPVQSTGADILRVACIMATRHGVKLLAPVHDAVLIEAPIERIGADVALMREIMRRASRVVLNADAAGMSCAPTSASSDTRSATATRAASRPGSKCSSCWLHRGIGQEEAA